MPRNKKNRIIQMAPHFSGFKPIGIPHESEVVEINFEEYEALKLCDYELLTQAEAAEMMKISRPTFTRIYESVRRKTAKAFFEGSTIRFEGGTNNIITWHKCDKCMLSFTLSDSVEKNCPLCKTPDKLKVAMAANEENILSGIETHFGRCRHYCIYDSETKTSEFIENPGYSEQDHAGHKAVSLLKEKKVSLVIAGRFGSKVVADLQTENIQMIVTEKDYTIKQIINRIK